jgi:parvulin-like peptidyl-prolyl isomerase
MGPRRGGIAEMLSMDSERAARVLLFGVVGLIVAVAVAFIGFGYWYSEIRPEGRTVLKADGIEVSFASMKRRMAFELFINPQYQQAVQILPEAAYASLLNELTLISRAESELGVTASDAEIDARLRQRIGVAADADQRVFADRFRDALDASGLNESEYRRLAHAEVLSQKIRDQFTAQAPLVVEQAQIEMISAADLEAAEAARDRVAAGEEWGVVAREVSTEPDVAETGGLQDYAPDGSLNQAFNDYAFNTAPGEISEPLSLLEGQGPFYVVRVVDRSEQPLTEDQKPSFVSRQYNEWLEDTQEKMEIERNWDVEDQSEALTDVLNDNPPQQQQQPIIVPTIAPDDPMAAPTAGADATAPAVPPADPSGEGDGQDENPDPSGAPQPDGE